MPVIHVSILEGRSVETKRAYFKALTDASVKCLGCRPESVSIVLSEMPFEHYARAGKMKADELAEAGLSVEAYHAREAGKKG
ncbi:MAG: tautomerase family protein [Deltaproteobacteria bacterium]|nr:tautomerase family protein [Deltaproteobacteria bacterium]